MVEVLRNICLAVFDPLFLWAVKLSPTLALALVGIASSGLLVLGRRWAADQDVLRRVDADKARLKALLRAARRRGAKAEARRCRDNRNAVTLRALPQEMRALLASILPLAMLGTWGWYRLGSVAPRAGEPLEVRFYTPVAAAGTTAHLVPQAGLQAGAWIARVEEAAHAGQPTGLAVFRVRAEARTAPWTLRVVCEGRAFEQALRVGQPTYAEPWRLFDGGAYAVEVVLNEMRPFGVVPGLGPWLPAWVVGYLLFVVPLYLLRARLLGVH